LCVDLKIMGKDNKEEEIFQKISALGSGPMESPPLNAGDMVGNYRILSELGSGTMGVVYRAFDVDLEIERAIKVLRPGKTEPLRRKFEAEAKITAKLDHPNIVRVFASGVFKDMPYMQMELIDGKSLRVLMQAFTRFHPVVALSTVKIICDALHFASKQSFSVWGSSVQNLVHRDLKPENILLSKTSGLKLTDFGLAQIGDERTFTGWGTVEYMSPEQHDNQIVDCRSDIFSIGIILYEMLCGKRPYSDELNRISSEKHSGRYEPAKESNPSISPDICDIIDKCLEPDRENRFQSCKDLGDRVLGVMEKISDNDPDTVIKEFSSNPSGYKIYSGTVLRRKEEKKTNPSKLKFRYLLFLAVIFVTGAVYVFNRDNGNFVKLNVNSLMNNFRQKKIEPKSISKVIPEKNDNGNVQQVEKKDQINTSSPMKSRVSQRFDKSVKEPQKQTRSVLEGVMDLYAEAKFMDVIDELKNLEFEKLPSGTRDSALILLADSYYMTSSISDVISLGRKYDLSDSRYNWVMALAHSVLGDFPKALQYMDRAVFDPVKIGKINRIDLLFDRAELYRKNYIKMNDKASKMEMLDAYKQFVEKSCTRNNDKNCIKAKEILENERTD